MTKADADNWKTPLGYYERAIAELSKAREEFQMELQTIREVQASQAALKEELQVTKEQLEATQKTANEFQSRVATAETAANDAQSRTRKPKSKSSAYQIRKWCIFRKCENHPWLEWRSLLRSQRV
jgi:chromosome segregation ATPase